MKKEQHKELLELYLEGHSSTEQEKELRDQNIDNAWIKYTRDNSETIPEKLEQSLKLSLRKKQQSAIVIRRSLISAAAIALILVSTLVFKPWLRNGQMSKTQIIATLNEVNKLLEEETKEILYEDEALIIYFK